MSVLASGDDIITISLGKEASGNTQRLLGTAKKRRKEGDMTKTLRQQCILQEKDSREFLNVVIKRGREDETKATVNDKEDKDGD